MSGGAGWRRASDPLDYERPSDVTGPAADASSTATLGKVRDALTQTLRSAPAELSEDDKVITLPQERAN